MVAKATASDTKRCYKRLLGETSLVDEGVSTKGRRPAEINAERDCHNFFMKTGFSLRLPIRIHNTAVEQGTDVIATDYILPRDWFSFLLGKAPFLLAGGCDPLEDQLKSFWHMFEWQQPNHAVFKEDRARLETTLPINLFSDEGKGPKRGNYVITSLESPIGLFEHECSQCECDTFVQQHLQHAPTCYGPRNDSEQRAITVASAMSSNLEGHSYLTRHIVFGLPDVVYKEYKEVYEEMLTLVANDFTSLFTHGLDVNGRKYFVALTGCKGDLKHMTEKWACLTRSYSHLGRTQQLGMCSLCHAGLPGYPWDQLAERPDWVDTLFASRPWDRVPPICTAPFDDTCPELIFRLDLFHVFKVGIGRDVCGSLVILARLGFYDDGDDPRNLHARLRRIYKSFRLWCSVNQKTPAVRYFSAALFNVKKSMKSDFPWSNTKASDTMLLLQYIKWYCGVRLANLPGPLQQHRRLLQLLQTTTKHGLALVDICYTHGLWLERMCAKCFYLRTMSFLSGYQALAKLSAQLGFCGFGIKPKWHALMHLAWEVRTVLETPVPRVMNPVAYCCDQCEDLVGKLCDLALVVDTRSINKRVIQRHFLKANACLRRLRNYHRSQGKLV